MKALYPMILLLMSGCFVRDPIEMKQTSLLLTNVKKFESEGNEGLSLQWRSLDGNLRFITTQPLQDSDLYQVGVVYEHCFIPK